MASEWTTFRLGSVCSKIGSGATPRGGSSVYLDEGEVALIRSQNIYNDGFHHDGLTYLTEQHATELANVEVARHDVLLNITGDSVARSCQVDPDILPARVNQHVAIIRPDPTLLWPRFLRYYLISPAIQTEMLSLAGTGATRNALTKSMIESFEVLAPADIDEQRAIATILGTLDDKIDLNRRMNETLEAMARALFKSWFVDFEPFRDGGMQDSPLGEIPVGWESVSFAEQVDIIGGGTPKTSMSEYWNGAIPWFSIVDAPRESDIWVIDTEKKITQAGVDNSATRILPEGTTIISARGTVGKVAMVGVPMTMNQSCYAFRGKLDKHGFFTYFASRELVSRLQQRAHGSVFDTFTRDTLAGVVVVAPPGTWVHVFEENVAPLLKRIRSNLFESRCLASIRDALLPKLLSGEIRVKDAEKFVEAQI